MNKNTLLLLVVILIGGGIYFLTRQIVYTPSEVMHVATTGTVMANINETVTGEYDATLLEEESFKYSHVSGYKHIYTYDDLGFTIGIDDPNIDEFYTKDANQLFTRKGNKVYQPNHPQNYVEMFIVEDKIGIEEVIKRNHLPKGCYLISFEGENDFGRKLAGTRIFMIASSPDGNVVATEECRPDDENPNSESFIQYIYHPDYPDKYYKYSIQDACAPSCGSFNIFEIN